MRVLGVDPGTVRLGYGVIDESDQGPQCVAWGCLEVPQQKPLHERLHRLYEGLQEVVERWQPAHLAVEEIFVAPTRGAKSAVAVGQAQAVALLLAAAAQMEVHRYAPTQVKQAVADSGGANKAQVQRMVKVRLSIDESLTSEDASDALAVALCHLSYWKTAQRMRTS